MSISTKTITNLLVATLLVTGIMYVLSLGASAQENEQVSEDIPAVTTSEQESETDASTDETNNDAYEYIAQPGDSYSVIARKAVQTYGLVKQVNLSKAQIVAAETTITQTAGSPLLNLGETVRILVDSIESAVNKAQELNESQLALWDTYARNADFNTDNVGENRE